MNNKSYYFEAARIPTATKTTKPWFVTRCGDCLHFQGTAHPALDSSCEKIGRLKDGVAPRCFVPNVVKLKRGTQLAGALNVLTSRMTSEELRILQGMLLAAERVRRTGFSLFEEVYFSVGDSKYLSNYYSAIVVSRASQKKLLLLGSPRTGSKGMVAQLDIQSILNQEAYELKRDELVAAGRIFDPNVTRNKIKLSAVSTYVPPVLDMDPEELEARAKEAVSRKEPRKNSRSTTVTLEKFSSKPKVATKSATGRSRQRAA